MHTVLIIDDEEGFRRLLARIVSLEGYIVKEAGTIREARKILSKESVDVILCDVRLPDGTGIAYTEELCKYASHPEVILLTAFGDITDSVQAMKNGAFDYIVKGNDNMRVVPLVARAIEKLNLQGRIALLEKQAVQKPKFEDILGTSPLIEKAKEMALKVARTTTTVLLLGETGTGKEVFASAIHEESLRRAKPFIALNCSSFGKDLLESELFGYKAGAFTGASNDKKGLIEEAEGGTLFLDEIGELPHDLQSKLLRVLESGEFIKLGDSNIKKADVRIIAATNRNLTREVEAGKFREDLFYRLNVFTITLPPLRDRKKDIILLARHFLSVFAAKNHSSVYEINNQFADALKEHPWKGNIRELRNIIERAVILSENKLLTPDDLPVDFFDNDHSEIPLSNFELARMEENHIKKVLQSVNNNKAEAARLLNIGITTLYRKIEEYSQRKSSGL